jgi:hypothetical protein
MGKEFVLRMDFAGKFSGSLCEAAEESGVGVFASASRDLKDDRGFRLNTGGDELLEVAPFERSESREWNNSRSPLLQRYLWNESNRESAGGDGNLVR